MPSPITRSPGIPISVGGLPTGMVAGGGRAGATSELDALVQRAAEAMRDAFGFPVTIRFNSDRESGGAWIQTNAEDAIGRNSDVQIGGSVTTERTVTRLVTLAKRYFDDDFYRERLAELDPVGTVRPSVYLSALVAPALCGNEAYVITPVESVKDGLRLIREHADLSRLR